MRRQQTLTADEVLAAVRAGWSEAEFTTQVIRLARACGWVAAHFRPARTAGGWRTAVQGDAGFPDLILVRAKRVVVAELKVKRGRPKPSQFRWLECFRAANVEAHLWRPENWDEIEKILG